MDRACLAINIRGMSRPKKTLHSLKKIIAHEAKRFASLVVEVYNTNPEQAGHFFLTLMTQVQLVQVGSNSFNFFEGFAEMEPVFESA